MRIKAGDINTEVEALAYLTGLYFDNGQADRALKTGEEAVRRSELNAVSGKSRGDAVMNLGYVLVLTRSNDLEGVKLLERASQIAKDSGLPVFDRALVLGNQAWAESLRGRFPEAERVSKESIGLYRSLPVDVCEVALPVIALARVYRRQRRFTESEVLLRDSYHRVSACMGTGYDLSLAMLGPWGYSLVFTGHAQEAVKHLEEGLPLARKTYAGRNQAYLLDVLAPSGWAYEAAGKPKQAEAAAREALQIIRDDTDNPEVAQAKRTLGRALFSQGRYSEALPYLQAADASYRAHAPDSLFAEGLHQTLELTRRRLAAAQH